MNLIIGNPAKYIQGEGAIKEIGKYCARMQLGKKALVTGGKTALAATQSAIEASFAENGLACFTELFRGEATQKEVDRLVNLGKQQQVDFIVGVGGGKAVDTAKAVSVALKTNMAVVPTVSATDASCSATAVIYTDDHIFDRVVLRPRNPELVLADTAILVKAPPRFLVAGMGDALATKFEAITAHQTGQKNFHGGEMAEASLVMANWCSDTILKYGLAARKDNAAGKVTPAFEHVVEAAVYASSISFENCNVACAHGMASGFTALHETAPYLHGEMVGLFTLTQLVLEKQPTALLNDIFRFCHAVGLPVTLAEVGLGQATDAVLMQGAVATTTRYPFVHHEPFKVTPEMLVAALRETDIRGRQLSC